MSKLAWTDEEKKAHSEKLLWARIEAAAASRRCSIGALAEMPERELRATAKLGRKSLVLLKHWAKSPMVP